MASAKYTVLIPTHDELGQQLQLSEAVHQAVTSSNVRVEAATVTHGNPYDSLTIWAEDTPESDSNIKQLGVHTAEVANVQSISVTKEGKTGATWQMRNPSYIPQQGAEPSALAIPLPLTPGTSEGYPAPSLPSQSG